ncbi:hypothetical protein ISF_06894 [Cordyceps fumosorosea ARSEF 2679]|uniref:Uncharacterized protein n=1 Tax=Cordyceps fumosorosea (strain ARSEF 2679) TaxID=1081104 RepID=A0A167QHR1_CORFA|nr:hypothetical protein ISF_06894 [Cordyceps fumosorosea ARSEF 2679]OAA57653.1 hypothetical protein ISF_06894 [Cordyceps fumosorosea ARSEF 2679]
MASDPGGDAAGMDMQPPDLSHHSTAHTQRDHDQNKMDAQQTATRPTATDDLQPMPPAPAQIPGGEPRAPRLRTGELHRRRSQILYSGTGSEQPAGGTGIQKPTARPLEQASALRRQGSSAGLYRPGAAAAATRERMYQMLAAAASAEDLNRISTSPIPASIDDRQKNSTMTTTRPIAIPRTRRNVEVEMLDASMPPPPPRAAATTTTNLGSMASSSVYSSFPPPPSETRDDLGTPSSSAHGNGGGLKRSASNSSPTVTVIECPILEVDEQCGNDEDLSWLKNDRELEQMLAVPPSSYRRVGRSSLTFRRSQEAAMQCSQVVRNVPRMRKRRSRKLDHRRHSTTLSESTICPSSSPSPTATPVG